MSTPFSNARIVKFGATPEEYCAEPEQRGSRTLVVRSGVLNEFLRNPRRWVDGYVSPESKSREWGNLLDCLALTPMAWPKRFCCTPATYTNKDGEEKPWRNDMRIEAVAKWHAQNQGKTIVSTEMNGAVHAALKKLRAHENIATLIDCSKTQVWVQGEYADKATGIVVSVKCAIDLVPDAEHPIFGDSLADLKTDRNISPRDFARDVCRYGWDLQAALELDLYAAAQPDDARQLFYHAAQENYEPYHCRLPQLSDDFVNRGRIRYQMALAKYCRCLASGHWPGYDDEEWPVTRPEPWMLSLEEVLDEMPTEEETEEQTADLIP